MSGPRFQYGDILHALTPHPDGGDSKHYVLVVGDPLDCAGDYVAIQITSTPYAGKTDFRLQASHPEFAATGLSHDSTLRCHKIFPIAESRARQRIGAAGPSIMAEIRSRLRRMFQL